MSHGIVSIERRVRALEGRPVTGGGEPGPTGATGAQGNPGAQGTQGIQGIQGAPGSVSACWPVGSIFMAAVATNPATLLGFGTWSAFGAGRMPVGFNAADADFDVDEKTGGAKTHTLTVAEMPAHTHNFLPRSATTGAVSSIVTGTLDTSSTISGNNQPHIQNTGGGGAHNNLPPFITVHLWKRTA